MKESIFKLLTLQNFQETRKRYLSCPVSLTIMTFKKLVHLKYELSPDDHLVEFFYQNYLLDDHLTIMDVVYMFDWKRVIIVLCLLMFNCLTTIT